MEDTNIIQHLYCELHARVMRVASTVLATHLKALHVKSMMVFVVVTYEFTPKGQMFNKEYWVAALKRLRNAATFLDSNVPVITQPVTVRFRRSGVGADKSRLAV
ncbi:hypothetical protein J6590_080264 [Homalodisca vitripennis]|nr:hypothetical protein J6590_080264 [Homalodisca vitripennis]